MCRACSCAKKVCSLKTCPKTLKTKNSLALAFAISGCFVWAKPDGLLNLFQRSFSVLAAPPSTISSVRPWHSRATNRLPWLPVRLFPHLRHTMSIHLFTGFQQDCEVWGYELWVKHSKTIDYLALSMFSSFWKLQSRFSQWGQWGMPPGSVSSKFATPWLPRSSILPRTAPGMVEMAETNFKSFNLPGRTSDGNNLGCLSFLFMSLLRRESSVCVGFLNDLSKASIAQIITTQSSMAACGSLLEGVASSQLFEREKRVRKTKDSLSFKVCTLRVVAIALCRSRARCLTKS